MNYDKAVGYNKDNECRYIGTWQVYSFDTIPFSIDFKRIVSEYYPWKIKYTHLQKKVL